jgi:hypothetical protein
MEDIVEQKGIEKIDEPKVEEVVEKKRKPRSEAQKAAFEKARKKRAENLAKKKLEEEQEVSIDETTTETQDTIPAPPGVDSNSPVVRPKAPVKKRGRPKGSKKLKREPEPVVGQPNFLPQNIPPEAGDLRYGYHQQNPYQFNPMMMYQQQFQPPPQVHNYYYGHQQPAQPHPNNPPPPQRPPTPDSPQRIEESSEEEIEQYIEYPQETYQEPQLRYRFA